MLKNAIKTQDAQKVDVNEQNPDAIGFYENLGFSVVGRSPLDGQGNPFPLFHLELTGDITMHSNRSLRSLGPANAGPLA